MSARYESQGTHSSHSGEAITRDLSITGMCLLPDAELEIGSRIRVSIHWPFAPEADAALELIGAGTVIRKEWSGIGVKLERKPIFRLRRVEELRPGEFASSVQHDHEWTVRQAAGADFRMLPTAAPRDRSLEAQRQGPLTIHDTADGLISTSVSRQGEHWIGHCWGGRHDYSCEGNDASDARSGVDAFFRTMYPDHVCSARCYMTPMDDESAPVRLRV